MSKYGEPWFVGDTVFDGMRMIHSSPNACEGGNYVAEVCVSVCVSQTEAMLGGGLTWTEGLSAHREAIAAHIVASVNAIAGLDPSKLAEVLAAADNCTSAWDSIGLSAAEKVSLYALRKLRMIDALAALRSAPH